jgi:asparagine synthetase B (glutamine-hydrolysing)|tara:strand:+ start:72 stop:287 length:216 start_codon:yes stop_codon:yes gene_type:complete
MCGIFGSVGKSRIDISENILPHRGPDDWGIVHHKCGHNWFTLFQSRLSIIGLGPQGHQPYQKYENYTLAYK